jgi:hypothetical protein
MLLPKQHHGLESLMKSRVNLDEISGKSLMKTFFELTKRVGIGKNSGECREAQGSIELPAQRK